MAEFEKIAQKEKSDFIKDGSALYPDHAEFFNKVFAYGAGGRDDRIDTGLGNADFEDMLGTIAKSAPSQNGDELTTSFNTLCEMFIYLESAGKKLPRKLLDDIRAQQSAIRKLLASRID